MTTIFVSHEHSPAGHQLLLDNRELYLPGAPFAFSLELMWAAYEMPDGCLYNCDVITAPTNANRRKVVQRLREKGFPIKTCSKSYRLLVAPECIEIDLRVFELPRQLIDQRILHRLYRAIYVEGPRLGNASLFQRPLSNLPIERRKDHGQIPRSA